MTLTDLAPRELIANWSDVQDVGRSIERVFRPCHVNYQLLGSILTSMCTSFRGSSMIPRPSDRWRGTHRPSRRKILPGMSRTCDTR